MPRLKLSDRKYEDDDGTWIDIELLYCHPWENGGPPDVMVIIKTFERQEGRGFDFSKPDHTKLFHLGEMEATMVHAFLGAAITLMPRQWAEYCAGEAEEKARA